MKYHLLNIVRGGLPVVGAVTGGLTVAQKKPGFAWVAGGSLAGWVAGYIARNLALGLLNGSDSMPVSAYVPPENLRKPPADTPQIPDFVQEQKKPEGDVIDISSGRKSPPDGMGTM